MSCIRMKRKWMFGLAGGGLLIIALSVFAYLQWFDFPAAARDAERLYAQLPTRGFPITSDQVQPPLRPGETNAAPFILSAERLKLASRPSGGLERCSDEDAAKYLAANKKFLDLMADASRMTRNRREYDYDLGLVNFMPQNDAAREAIDMLILRSSLSAKAGRSSESLSDLNTCRRLALLIQDEPSLISQFTARNQSRKVMAGAARAASLNSRDPKHLDNLIALLRSGFTRVTLENALKVESYMVLATMRNLKFSWQAGRYMGLPFVAEFRPNHMAREGLPASILYRAWLGPILQTHLDAYDVLSDGRLSSGDRSERLEAISLAAERNNGPIGCANAFLAMDYLKLSQLVRTAEAERRAALAFISVLQFRNRNGRLPTSSGDLMGWPIDPATEKPIGYARTREGFKVWSTGNDLKDDGGQVPPESHGVREGSPKDFILVHPVRERKPPKLPVGGSLGAPSGLHGSEDTTPEEPETFWDGLSRMGRAVGIRN